MLGLIHAKQAWHRLWHPRRTIWPTRDGWWCLFVVVGLGVAAINTGNNLLYLLVSLLLSIIVVSGVLSEQTMRGLEVVGGEPEEIYAGRPALFGSTLVNRKGWLTSYSITLELLGPDSKPHAAAAGDGAQFLYVPRLEAGGERLVMWEQTLPRRGRHRLPGVRLTTRFPFGLFVKAGRPVLTEELTVFPAIHPISSEMLQELASAGDAATRRRGRGSDLYNLRVYRAGDDPRLIHWRSSAKTQALTVRELEAETTEDTRIVLVGSGAGNPALLEAGLSEAASVAVHLLRAGSGVELVGPGLVVPLGRGRGHLRRVLTALALYQPGGVQAPPEDGGRGGAEPARARARPLRWIRVRIG
ncbi:MAG TPA: DUF58 domain-containing protein [Methylomirabilota bacterium]|nr:DUF58 domain-containing protein [Methylomirabilota bacterium]